MLGQDYGNVGSSLRQVLSAEPEGPDSVFIRAEDFSTPQANDTSAFDVELATGGLLFSPTRMGSWSKTGKVQMVPTLLYNVIKYKLSVTKLH